jgi:hypothetical protein
LEDIRGEMNCNQTIAAEFDGTRRVAPVNSSALSRVVCLVAMESPLGSAGRSTYKKPSPQCSGSEENSLQVLSCRYLRKGGAMYLAGTSALRDQNKPKQIKNDQKRSDNLRFSMFSMFSMFSIFSMFPMFPMFPIQHESPFAKHVS